MSDERFPAVASGCGCAVLAAGALMALDRWGALSLGWGWCLPLLCLVAGAGLLAVTERSPAAYAGVFARLGTRHGLPAWPLRTATVATAPLAGLGVVGYAALALVQALGSGGASEWRVEWRRSAGTGLVGLACVLACVQAGVRLGSDAVLWPALAAGSALSLFWWLPSGRRDPARSARPLSKTVRQYLKIGLGLLVVVFAASFVGLYPDLSGSGRTILGGAAAVLGLTLVVGPRWLRTSRALAAQRLELARATERADFAGLVHDSVMQTLALIQDRADDPAQVRTLARRQERELRNWLLSGPAASSPPRSIATALRAAAAEVEDVHQVKIEVVTVGDAPLDEDVEALIAAAREALVNAAKHASGAPVSLFAEVEPGRVEAYVRDRGPGFELDAIPDDRRGVRDSIVARMVRHGGHAAIRSAPGGGCEVRLVLGRSR